MLHYAPFNGRTSGTQYIITSPIVNIKKVDTTLFKISLFPFKQSAAVICARAAECFQMCPRGQANRYVVFHMVLPCVGSPLLLAEVHTLGSAASSLWGEEGLVLLLCWLPPQDKAGD